MYPDGTCHTQTYILLTKSYINFFYVRSISTTPNNQAGDPPIVGCQRLLIQYIPSYSSYLETVSSIRSLSKPHTDLIKPIYHRIL
jgi:hypothetical protein